MLLLSVSVFRHIYPHAHHVVFPSSQETLRQHAKFKEVLEAAGAEVYDVREVLTKDVDKYVEARIALEDLAAQSLTYKLDDTCDPRLLNKEDKYFLGNAYKAKVLEAMSADQLVDIILTCPTVHISPSYRDTVCVFM